MGPQVLGRDDECATIDRLLEATQEGLSGALVLRGDAGMAKTTLLDHAAASASGFQVLRLAGVESESEFGYGALHRLLLPFLASLAALPARQQAALESAFGLELGPPADRFIVGLAALSLLANAAQLRPILCIVDDAQWLDRESLDALTFVALRVAVDRVALLFAVRGSPNASGPPFDGLPVLPVEQLPDQSVRDLLRVMTDGPIRDEIAHTIADTTRGCPLAVVELARNLTPEQLAGSSRLPDPLPITGRLERHFVAQVRALPAASQAFLLLAAAETSGEPAVLWHAAAEMGLEPSAADEAVAADLIALTPHVEFRHPLIRSAVLAGAATTERRRAHAVFHAPR
jgi:hypothetical protein